MVAAALVAVLVAYAPAGATTAQDTLKQPPFAPTDVNLFGPAVYSSASAMSPASSGPTDEATPRSKLSDLLNQRFPNSPKTVNQALALFDSDKTKQIVPDPRVRAALVALKGAAGEPAIAGILDGTYSVVRFGTVDPRALAQMFPPSRSSDGTARILVNQKFQFEDFRLFVPLLAHEALHRDDLGGNKEELVNKSIETLVYG